MVSQEATLVGPETRWKKGFQSEFTAEWRQGLERQQVRYKQAGSRGVAVTHLGYIQLVILLIDESVAPKYVGFLKWPEPVRCMTEVLPHVKLNL